MKAIEDQASRKSKKSVEASRDHIDVVLPFRYNVLSNYAIRKRSEDQASRKSKKSVEASRDHMDAVLPF